VIMGVEIVSGDRPALRVHVRAKVRRRGRCGRCGGSAGWFDNGDGVRTWRHLDAGYATVELVAVARRVDCRGCGPTVAAVPWALRGPRTRPARNLGCFERRVSG
jgi:transposase